MKLIFRFRYSVKSHFFFLHLPSPALRILKVGLTRCCFCAFHSSSVNSLVSSSTGVWSGCSLPDSSALSVTLPPSTSLLLTSSIASLTDPQLCAPAPSRLSTAFTPMKNIYFLTFFDLRFVISNIIKIPLIRSNYIFMQ